MTHSEGIANCQAMMQMEHLSKAFKVIQEKLQMSPRFYLALDYDGTLTKLVNDPKRAFLTKRTRELLRRLASNHRCILAIVSGRSKSDLSSLVDVDRAYYVGDHGLEIRGPALKFTHPAAREMSGYLPELSQKLKKALRGTGALVENKGLTLSVHYRNASTASLPEIRAAVKFALQDYRVFRLSYGKKVVDVRPAIAWNKGNALMKLMENLGRYPVVCAGDDQTDEEAFMILKDETTILVSQRPKRSYARYYLRDAAEVADFIEVLASWLEE